MMVAGLMTSHPRAHQAPVASALARITDDALASSLHGATRCDAENGEAFGVAAACAAAQVPFAAVLGVTNLVGSTAQKDWAHFQRDAVVQAASTVANWLHAGAQGLPH
jgi:nucleoside phosphorylase